MKTLILETSTEKALIALLEDGQPLLELHLSGGPELSKRLSLDVSELLNGTKPDQIGIGQGPGSYTGIRVAAALAQGLALGWNIPLFGFCSLVAFRPSPDYAVLVDARSGGVYTLIGEVCQKRPLDDPILQTLPLIASPHPVLIQKRLSLPGEWLETEPNVNSVKLEPLTLTY